MCHPRFFTSRGPHISTGRPCAQCASLPTMNIPAGPGSPSWAVWWSSFVVLWFPLEIGRICPLRSLFDSVLGLLVFLHCLRFVGWFILVDAVLWVVSSLLIVVLQSDTPQLRVGFRSCLYVSSLVVTRVIKYLPCEHGIAVLLLLFVVDELIHPYRCNHERRHQSP